MFLSPGADCIHVVGRTGSGEPSVLGFVDARGAAGVFLYYARKRCKHLSVLLLLHGLVLACFYIIPAANGVNRGIRLLVGAGFVIYSLWLRFRTEDFASDPLPLPLAAGIAFLCLFLQHYQGNNVWDLYYRMSLILVFLLYAVILFCSPMRISLR